MAKLSAAMAHLLEEAAEGLRVLEQQEIVAEFDPTNPASVEAAIAHVEHVIDTVVIHFRGNRLVKDAAEAIKAECRTTIYQYAADPDIERGTRTLH